MKQLTVLLTLADPDEDIFSDVVQQGICDGITTMEGVKDARVIGVSEGPDPS